MGTTVLLLILVVAFGPKLLGSLQGGAPNVGLQSSAGGAIDRDQYTPTAKEQRLFAFASQVLDDAQRTWQKIFSEQLGQPYQPARMVVFTDHVSSACGSQSSAVGPFYCPGDRRVYVDLRFFAELDQRFGAPGDFAQAYVIAHEVGHHVQHLLGVFATRPRRGETANQHSIRQELMADCLAGVWGFWAQKRKLLDPGDLQEGFRAAKAIGDDTLQRRGQGRVTPETWTHGSSKQRQKWFRKGLRGGRLDACDAMSVPRP